nr:hypothetical protein [Actinocorallia populi]
MSDQLRACVGGMGGDLAFDLHHIAQAAFCQSGPQVRVVAVAGIGDDHRGRSPQPVSSSSISTAIRHLGRYRSVSGMPQRRRLRAICSSSSAWSQAGGRNNRQFSGQEEVSGGRAR